MSVFVFFRARGRCPCPGSGCSRFRDPEVLPQTKQLLCPTSPSSLRDATSPSRGGFGRPLGFISSPEALLLGELSSGARLRGCIGGFSAREADAPGFGIQRLCLGRSSSFVQPLRHPFGMPPPLVGEARAFPPRSWLSLWESWLRSRLRGCMGGFSAREADASGFGIQRFCLRRSSCFVQPLRQRLWRCHLP